MSDRETTDEGVAAARAKLFRDHFRRAFSVPFDYELLLGDERMAEAERRGAEKALRDAAIDAEREFQLPREFGFEVRRFIEKRADAYRAGADQ